MVALKTVALIDARRLACLFASELGRSVKVKRVHAQDSHGWAVIAPDRSALEVFAHCLPYLAAELWPNSRGK